MNPSPVEQSLMRAFEEFEVVDAHEHLRPESVRLAQNVDVFTLFSHYTRVDLLASGMPAEYWDGIHDPSIPLKQRWELFAPYFPNIKYGSYARPAFIAAKEIYGFDSINKENFEALSETIAAANTPGIYKRILREKCNIRVALTVANRVDFDLDLLIPLMLLNTYAYNGVRSKGAIEKHATILGVKVKTLDDYLELVRKGLKEWKSQGVVGIKMWSRPFTSPDESKAKAIFRDIISGRRELPELPEPNVLRSFLMEEMLDMSEDLGFVVAVHTGVWGDFRELDPQHMIPILSRHPRTKFDIFHMGIPYIRETAMLGKNFPNAWLNLCWCHIISPRMACLIMDELIDLIPINKVIAFGGDYRLPVEKVYGHLVIARENIARVFGHRIEDGTLTENEAIDIAKKWFYDNPKYLYQLRI